MGMVANFLRVTNSELEAYLKDSSLLKGRIYGSFDEEEEDEEKEDPALTNIDKSWEGILFLLTGQKLKNLDHPMGKVFFGGQYIDEEQEIGYGPAEYLTPEQVKELNEALAKITEEELTERYDPGKMTELHIYPTIWEEEGSLYYLLAFFQEVQKVYATAAKNNEAIITFIN